MKDSLLKPWSTAKDIDSKKYWVGVVWAQASNTTAQQRGFEA
jgi:hypothetical protein